jgi:phosphonate transport system substrate-binding protein
VSAQRESRPVRPAALARRALVLGAALGAAGLRAQTPPRDLRLGLVPYLSTRAMLGLYQPLRLHLEAELRGPVTLFTAADFRALAENARSGEYALALLPAHFARLAVEDWGHALVARTWSTSEVHLIAQRERALELPDGLRGQRIAVIDPLSLTVLALLRWLAERGLVPGRDVAIDHVRSAGSAAIAVQRGDAVAMVGAIGQLRDFGISVDSDLIRVATLETIPTPAFVAHPAVPAEQVAQWRRALLGFVPPAGLQGALSTQRFVAADLRDFDRVTPYMAETRRLLALPRPPATRPGEAKGG